MTKKHLDLWFAKPRLCTNGEGWWCCRTEPDGAFINLIGNGRSPAEAWDGMKRSVVTYCKRLHPTAVVEFV